MNLNTSLAYILMLLQISMPAFSGILTLPELGSAGSKYSMAQTHENLADKTSNNEQEISKTVANSVVPLTEAITSKGGNASSYAISSATNFATDALQQWISQYGAAKIQLGINDDFHLSDSSIDTLFPLYNQKEIMLFSQLGYRHKEDRNTGNFGLGGRYFPSNYMVGLNFFYDNDFTGNNKRTGAGLEYWRDYLKLNANGYFGITNWHQSRDFDDYDERPANGFDIRVEGYLPKVPQFGTKLVYEQYYGNDVALFGRNSREKNPKAVTIGLNYTPVPLFTLGVDFRDSQKGSNNDTVIGFQFNYDFGVPISNQLDPTQVAIKRTLAGSRMDLVERNNDIVLEYRKQDILSAQITDQLKGLENTNVPAQLHIKSKYGVSDIKWSGTVLSQTGAKIIQMQKGDFSTWLLTLPAYRENMLNEYTLTAVVRDKHGNESAPTTSNVLVEKNNGKLVQGSLSCSPQTVVIAPGNKAICTVSVDNGQGMPLPDAKVKWAADNGTLSTPMSTSNNMGVATVELQNNKVSTSVVRANLNTDELSTDVRFTAGSVSSTLSTLTATPEIIKANGKEISKIIFNAKDDAGNIVDNLKVDFVSAGVSTQLSAVKNEGKGIYSATLSGFEAGIVTIGVTSNGSKIDGQKVIVRLIAGEIDAAHSIMKAAPAQIQADGKTTSVVTLIAKDSNNNPVTGAKFTFKKINNIEGILGNVTEDGQPGEYRATFTAGMQAGQLNIGAMQGDIDTHLQTSIVLKAQHISPTHSTLSAVPTSIEANGQSTSVITFKALSETDLPLGGLSVTFKDDGSVPVTISHVDEISTGIYTATLTSGLITGVVNIHAEVAGTAVGEPVKVTLVHGAISSSTSTLSVNKSQISADGIDTALLTFIAKDANGNGINGLSVTFVPAGVAVTITEVKATGSGHYTAILTGKLSGKVTINANVDGHDSGVTPVGVTLATGAQDPSSSTIEATPATIFANGIQASTITFKAKDAVGHPLTGLDVSFNYSGVPVQTTAVEETSSGVYVAKISGTAVGEAIIAVSIAGKNATQSPAKVMLIKAYAFKDIQAIRNNAAADGIASDEVKVTVVDKQTGQPAKGQIVSFTTAGSAVLSATKMTTDANGSASVQLTSTKAGDNKIEATLSDSAFVVMDTANVDVTFSELAPLEFKEIKVNGYTVHGPRTFPKTGFKGAKFQLVVDSSMDATEFEWSTSDSTLTKVDASGNVTFTDNFPAGTTITISAKMKSLPSRVATYTIRVKDWFIEGTALITFEEARVWCREQGYSSSGLEFLSNSASESPAVRAATGQLWPDWGNMNAYGWNTISPGHWAGTDLDHQRYVDEIGLASGGTSRDEVTFRHVAVCQRAL